MIKAIFNSRTLIFILLILNGIVVFYGLVPFFVTFADIPEHDANLIALAYKDAETALGHARHLGAEEMRAFLFKPLLWLMTALIINFVTICGLLYHFKIRVHTNESRKIT